MRPQHRRSFILEDTRPEVWLCTPYRLKREQKRYASHSRSRLGLEIHTEEREREAHPPSLFFFQAVAAVEFLLVTSGE